jgi:hypothetical protein
MSQVDLTAALRRIVAQMHEVGYSTAQIIAAIVGEAPTKTAAATAPVPLSERLISVELANGVTKQYPWTPELQAQVDRAAKAKAQAPAPAPKPLLQEHEIVFTPSRATTHDAQVASYQEAWTPTDNDVDLDALIAEQEADLAKMKALRGSK